MTNNIDRFADAIAEITANKLGLNTQPDPDVAAWMESLGFERGDFYYTSRAAEMDISDEEADLFYHAQQRAVLEGRIDAVNEVVGSDKDSDYTHMVAREYKRKLEVQLQNNKEGKL